MEVFDLSLLKGSREGKLHCLLEAGPFQFPFSRLLIHCRLLVRLGALITILTIAMDPFAQQLVKLQKF